MSIIRRAQGLHSPTPAPRQHASTLNDEYLVTAHETRSSGTLLATSQLRRKRYEY